MEKEIKYIGEERLTNLEKGFSFFSKRLPCSEIAVILDGDGKDKTKINIRKTILVSRLEQLNQERTEIIKELTDIG